MLLLHKSRVQDIAGRIGTARPCSGLARTAPDARIVLAFLASEGGVGHVLGNQRSMRSCFKQTRMAPLVPPSKPRNECALSK